MKRLLVLIGLMIASTASYAQLQYTVDKVSHGTVNASNTLNPGTFNQLNKRFKASLYNDALVFDEGFDGLGDTYYKFVRVITTDDPNKRMWNALDRNNAACQITIKDYDTYSLIAIKYLNSNAVTIYKTL